MIAGAILLGIFTILFTIIIRNFVTGIRNKDNYKLLFRKNIIFIGILALEVIGVILARIKFYLDFGI